MTEAKNEWIGTEAGRKKFFGELKGMGLSADEARTALGVTSMKEVQTGLHETLGLLEEWNQATREEPAEDVPESQEEVAETPTGREVVHVEKPDISLPEWQGRQDIDVLGNRIKAMLPGGEKLSTDQARALAQYSLVMGANPFRGEVYAYKDSTGFHIVEGYKLLVRWAMRQSLYSETFEPLEDLEDGDIGFRCRILRDDRMQVVEKFVEMGADFEQAYNKASVFADGVVSKSDMTTKSGRPMDPPKGWTWRQVARKRALKNALNLSHGAPSLKEIAEETWMPDSPFEALPAEGQSPEMTAQWAENGRRMQAEHPELFKGTKSPRDEAIRAGLT